MKKERLYDVMVSILTTGLIGGFVWVIGAEKNFEQVRRNADDIKEIQVKQDTQHRRVIEALHRIELKLENKKDRE